VNLRKHIDVLGDADDTTSKTSGIHLALPQATHPTLRRMASLDRLHPESVDRQGKHLFPVVPRGR
jgi:hypothetical protein